MIMENQVEIKLLGAFEVSHTPEIKATKLRQLLAMLAVNANVVVSTEQLIDELWPYGPPRSVKTIVQTYVYQLRKTFSRGFDPSRGVELLVTRPGGYVLEVPRTNIDVFQFLSLVESGRNTLHQGQAGRAADLLHQSLRLWRGPVFADVTSGLSLRGLSVFLEEQRLEALALCMEADLANDRHREIVGELRLLVSKHQLNESFHILLMRALHRSGRRGEALRAYSQLHRVLDEELGLEPSVEAKRAQREILEAQPMG